nr:G protein-coupled receptor [Proales similis]
MLLGIEIECGCVLRQKEICGASTRFFNLKCFLMKSLTEIRQYVNVTESCTDFSFNKLYLTTYSGFSLFNGFSELRQLGIQFDVVYLSGFSGIDLNSDITSLSSQISPVQLIFEFSKLKLEIEAHRLTECTNRVIQSTRVELNFAVISFYTGISYPEPVCSGLFKNARLDVLVLNGIINSLVKRNILQFEETVEQNQSAVEINSKVNSLSMQGLYGLKLNKKLIPAQIFKKTSSISFKGVVRSFEPGLLKAFTSIKSIVFNLNNAKQFFHENLRPIQDLLGTESAPPIPLSVKFSQEVEGNAIGVTNAAYLPMNIILDEFLFNDTDICLFKSYRIENVSYQIDFRRYKTISCSCTIRWLLASSNRTVAQANIVNENILDFYNHSDSCDFEKLFAKCEIGVQTERIYLNAYDLTSLVQYLELLLFVIGTPALAVLLLMLSSFWLYVFARIKKSEKSTPGASNLNEQLSIKLNLFLYYQVILSLFSALILLFSNLTECIQYESVFCSPLVLHPVHLYFRLAFQVYLANLLKTASSLVIMVYSVSRLLVYFENTNKFKQRVANISSRTLLLALFLFSSIVNLGSIFFNQKMGLSMIKDSDGFSYFYNIQHSFDVQITEQAFLIGNLFLNNLILPVSCFFIDIWLLRTLRLLSDNKNQLDSTRAKLKKSEKKLTRAVFISGMIIFALKTPQIAVSIIRLAYSLDYESFRFCYFKLDLTQSVCPNLFDICEFFYSLSFLPSLVLCYMSNPQFRQVLASLRNRNS